jgi:hypothetical protein
MAVEENESRRCEACRVAPAREFELLSLGAVGEPSEKLTLWLCVRCARAERRRLGSSEGGGC